MTDNKERCQRAQQKLLRMERAGIEFSEAAWLFAYEDEAECCPREDDAKA